MPTTPPPAATDPRQVVVDRHGPPDVLRVRYGAVPEPGEDQVLVAVSAAGVNFLDLYQRSGAYTVEFPWTPGIEGSGIVVATGARVAGLAPGDRVAWAGHPGSYASHCVIPADQLVPVPDSISLSDAAAALIHGMTAHFLTADVAPLDETMTCVVHAAAGGVGGLLCQLARLRGATVIGTVSTHDKADAAVAAGAAHVIVYTDHRFAEQVRQLTGGQGADVVYDAVGRDTFGESLASLRPRGTLVLYGQTSGHAPPVDPQELNRRGSLYLTKASLSHYDRTREQASRRAGRVLGLIQEGRLRPRLHGEYPLEAAAAAHAALESRATAGKILLRP